MIGYPQPLLQNTPQQQSGTLISVRNEQEAKNYPMAHGVSLTFKNENAPYLYTKTLGFSQMDVPVFERFRLVKEEDPPINNEMGIPTQNESPFDNEIKQLKEQVELLKKNVEALMAFKAEFGGESDDQ